MSRIPSLLTAVFCSILPLRATAESLSEVSGQFQHAQFLSDNAMALKFRLALLDHAAPGAQVRIATYTFENGAATQALGAHMCSAITRGVKVELIADSKSGEILGQDNPYNADPEIKKNEKIYQDLAACGVKFYVHNYNTDFVTLSLLNKRVPNIFGAQSGGSINPITAYDRFKAIRQRLLDKLQPTLAKNKLSVNLSGVLSSLQDLLINLQQLQSMAGEGGEAGPTAAVEDSITVLSRAYKALLNDPFWAQFDRNHPDQAKAKLGSIKDAIVQILETDPVLKNVRDRIRVFNRINHRKLFIVQEPNGESCVIVGGRNLGDHYLTNAKDSFRDGDVFFCSSHVPDSAKFFEQANASLDQLKTDTSDHALKDTGKTVSKLVTTTQHVNGARVAAINAADLRADDLGEIVNPMLLTSSWDSRADGVKMALLEAILHETKEIYIETAYAELNYSVREALVKALDKGVKVRIVTNGMFISDGGSKLIRPWMAKWNEEMAAKYKGLFEVDYAPLSAGHMIHFKGAAFRCQNSFGDHFYREYIVGSHNFHPRSGYSDKENAIEWRVPTDGSCPEIAQDLVSLRNQYYQQERAHLGAPVLRKYPTLFEEVQEVTAMFNDPKNADIARAVDRVMYLNGNTVLPDKLAWMQELLDESGIRDLIGTLL